MDHRGAAADHRHVEQRERGHEQLAVTVQRQALGLDPDPQAAPGELHDTGAVADAVGLAQPGQRRDAAADHQVLARVALGRERREQVLELARARRARGDAQADAVVDREAQVRGARRAGAPPRGTRGREGAPGDEARARERHADRDRADAGQRGGVPGVDGRRDVAGDRRAQRPRDVRALGRQRPAGAGEPADLRLRAALGVAARGEVAPRRPLGRHAVVDDGARLVEDDPVGEPPPRAQAELGLLAADRHGADSADVLAEPADGGEHVAPEGHVRADDVAHRPGGLGHPAVRAADDPVELGRERPRPPAVPARPHGPPAASTRGSS